MNINLAGKRCLLAVQIIFFASEGQFSSTAHYKALLEIGDRIKVSTNGSDRNSVNDECDSKPCEHFNYLEIFLMQKL